MKKIIITGGSKGIGLECVKRFSSNGWYVICCSRNPSAWEQVISCFPELKEVEYHICDVSKEDDVASMFHNIREKHGHINAAVNNASPKIASTGNVIDVDLALLRETADNDFWSFVLCLKEELGLMCEESSIVNITSINAIGPIPGAAMYGAAKSAVESLTKSVALEAISNNVRLNTVAPGVTWTPRWDENAEGTPGIREEVGSLVPMKRFARVSEIVDAVDWLISEKSSYVVGHTLVVDGGLSLVRG